MSSNSTFLIAFRWGSSMNLAVFDGSVLVDRTKGEMSARCEGEAANFLALNLADDIVHGRKDVESAERVRRGDESQAAGQPARDHAKADVRGRQMRDG